MAIIGDMNARVGTSSEIPDMSWQDDMSNADMSHDGATRTETLICLAATCYCSVLPVIC